MERYSNLPNSSGINRQLEAAGQLYISRSACSLSMAGSIGISYYYRSSHYFYGCVCCASFYGSVQANASQALVYSFFSLLSLAAILRSCFREVKTCQNTVFMSIIKNLRYKAQICYGLEFWHHIYKTGREMARTGARCSQLKYMPS